MIDVQPKVSPARLGRRARASIEAVCDERRPLGILPPGKHQRSARFTGPVMPAGIQSKFFGNEIAALGCYRTWPAKS